MKKKIILAYIFLSIVFCCACERKKSANTEETIQDVLILNQNISMDKQDNEMVEESEDLSMGATMMPSEDAKTMFVEDYDYNIKDLIRKYYDYLVEGEFDLASYLTNDSTKLDKELFMLRSEYIQSIKSLTCYIMEGMVEGTYIVVACCGVETTLDADIVMMAEAFYIGTNESDTLYIVGGNVGDEIKSYNSIMLAKQEMVQILLDISQENDALIKNNPELEQIKGIIIPDGIFRFLYE